jgi:hypothetical protein
MEKVISSGIRLILLFLVAIIVSCGEKKPESTDNRVADTVVIDTMTSDQEQSYAAEIFEYRSETLKNCQLYAIHPLQDVTQFLMVKNDEARLLTFDDDVKVKEGRGLTDDEFKTLKLFNDPQGKGIMIANSAGTNFIFRQSQTKRSLTIEEQYAYTESNDSGNFALAQDGDAYFVAINVNAGDHFCELEGRIRIQGNIAYFRGKLYAEKCKLIFFFTDKKVQSIQISSNTDCGCGANASLNHQFTLK